MKTEKTRRRVLVGVATTVPIALFAALTGCRTKPLPADAVCARLMKEGAVEACVVSEDDGAESAASAPGKNGGEYYIAVYPNDEAFEYGVTGPGIVTPVVAKNKKGRVVVRGSAANYEDATIVRKVVHSL